MARAVCKKHRIQSTVSQTQSVTVVVTEQWSRHASISLERHVLDALRSVEHAPARHVIALVSH